MPMSEAAVAKRVVIRGCGMDSKGLAMWEVYLKEEGSDGKEIARERFESAKVAGLYARELMRLFRVEQLDEEA
jgi:hypothetical protein